MDKEVKFGRTLEKIRKRAKEQGNIISEEEIREMFAWLSLDEAQLALVHDYLKKRGVGIGKPADMDEYLDDGDRNYMEMYLDQLSAMETVEPAQKEELLRRVMAGDGEAKEKLIAFYLPQVADLAKLYAGQGVMLEELIGEGNVALVSGIELLGALEDAAEAEGMLGKRMMDAMEAFIAEHVRSGDIGKQAAERVNRVRDAAKELSDALLRKVTVLELSRESEIPVEEIQEAIRLCAGKIEEIEGIDGNGKPGF